MPWGGNPSTDPADAVRALIGDTDASAPKLSDDTYVLILATEPTLYARAAMAAFALSSIWAEQMTKRVGDLWREAKVVYEHYADLAQKLRLEGARKPTGSVFVGGHSVADNETRDNDTSITQPNFRLGMMDSFRVTPATPVESLDE